MRSRLELYVGEAVYELIKGDNERVRADETLPAVVQVWDNAPWSSLQGLLDLAILARWADASVLEDIPYLRLPSSYPQVSANFTGGEVIAFHCAPKGKVSQVVVSQHETLGGMMTAHTHVSNSLLSDWAQERFDGAPWQVMEWLCIFALHQRWLRWSDQRFTIVLPESVELRKVGDQVFMKQPPFF